MTSGAGGGTSSRLRRRFVLRRFRQLGKRAPTDGLQVHQAGLGDSVAPPLRHGRIAHLAQSGDLAGPAQGVDDSVGFGHAGIVDRCALTRQYFLRALKSC